MASPPTGSANTVPPTTRPTFNKMESVDSTNSTTKHGTQLVSPTHRRPNSSTRTRLKVIWTGRISFFFLLFAAAAIMGFWAYFTLKGAENDLAERQFESMANRALNEAAASVERQRWAALTAASMVSEQQPEASSWPLFSIPGFERIVADLLRISSGRELVYAPLVRRSEQAAFETIAFDYYKELDSDAYDGAYSSFGEGVWGFRMDPVGSRYHDTEGDPDDILLPLFQGAGIYAPFMLNTYFFPTFRLAIDSMLSCSEERATSGDLGRECAAITSAMDFGRSFGTRLGASLLYPIYPANAPGEFSGYMTTLLLFQDVLENIFADEVNGIDCVFTDGDRSFMYTIREGVPELVSKDEDLHDLTFDHMGVSVRLTDPEYFNDESPMFTLHVYPNSEFYDVYATNNPTVAITGVIAIVLGMTLVFAIYDLFVRKEFKSKKELLQAKRQFMRFVSHEVRTPLNSVFMGLQLMKSELAACLDKGQSLDDSAASHAHSVQELLESKSSHRSTSDPSRLTLDWFLLTQEIQANVQGAVDVLNDLLNYDKIEQSSLQLELSLFSICSTIDQCYNEFSLSTKQKNLKYELAFISADCTQSTSVPRDMKDLQVLGDSVRIFQVLRNLISNAMKFTPEEGTLNIKARFVSDPEAGEMACQDVKLSGDTIVKAAPAGELELCVEDSGAGMSEEQLAKLFSDGVQFNVNQLQSGKGSGLGLYIAKGIVEQHGGSLTAWSPGLGKGTTFTMKLPLWQLCPCVSDTTRYESSESAWDDEEEHKRTFHVLVVDDVKSNRKLLARLLRNEGHTCDEAEDGSEAVSMFRAAKTSYDAVVMDYEMPIMNGPEAAREIRKLDERVHIAGLTGNVLQDDVQYFKSCGANGVLPKPLKLVELEGLWMEHGLFT